MAPCRVTDNFRKAISGKEYKEQVGAPMVIFPFSLSASNAYHWSIPIAPGTTLCLIDRTTMLYWILPVIFFKP